MKNKKRKEIENTFQDSYEKNFRAHFDWLPKKLIQVKPEHYERLATIDSITGQTNVFNLLRLRKQYLNFQKS